MTNDTQTFSVTVESPHGRQAIEQWEHWINKVADEADARWGITISIEEVNTKTASTEEFE